MPKITWISGKKKPKVKYLHALFRAYMSAKNMSSKDLGMVLGCSPESVRAWINKSGEEWKIGKLKSYCDALGIPYSEAFEAAMK